MVKISVLENTTNDTALFDLDPGKGGIFLCDNGAIKSVGGVRMHVPLLEINSCVLYQIAYFIDKAEASKNNSTIVINNSEDPSRVRIGVFSI